MSEAIKTEPRAAPEAAAAGITEALLVQVLALDAVFRRALKDAHSLHDIRRALKAQARCRATFKILLALRAVAGDTKKFADSNEGTIQRLEISCIANGLSNNERSAPAPALRPRSRPGLGPAKRPRRSWSPERRARQAAAIRTWQPWEKSTGPRTAEGKARSAGNALKHGRRSRAFNELRREDRRILECAAGNIAIAKRALAARLVRPVQAPVLRPVRGEDGRPKNAARSPQTSLSHSIGIGPATLPLIPSRRVIMGESRSRRHVPPADIANPTTRRSAS